MALNIHQCPLRNSGPCPLVHCCFLTTHLSFLHPLPSLMNNCLNLLFGTQERTLMPNESYFLQTENQAEERICNWEDPIGNCSDLVLAWAPLVIKGQLNRRKTNKRLIICIPPVYMCICVSMSECMCVPVCSVLSDFLQTHGLYPIRLPCPWNIPGKNTGLGGHFLHPVDLPNAGIKPMSLVSPALAGRFFTTSATLEANER